VLVKPKDGGALFRPEKPGTGWRDEPKRTSRQDARNPASLDWKAEAERLRQKLTPARVADLASALGAAAHAIEALGAGWADAEDLKRMRASGAGWSESYPAGAFAFPEQDGGGRIVGFSLRAPDGRKGAPASSVGARRGLIVPSTLGKASGPVLAVEGASDVAAAVSLGHVAVGRPSNSGGAEKLAQLLKCREVLIVGERDQKPDGSWPGRDGAEGVARRVATDWKKPVRWTLPPEGSKDVREWVNARVAVGLDLANADACRAAGQELLAALQANAEEAEPERKPAQSELLVRQAHELYRFGLADGDEPFAVVRDGPNVALPLRGSAAALRALLAREYRRRFQKTPSASALADALTVLHGEALDSEAEPVFLRVAEFEGSIVIDLGDVTGRAVIVGPPGWKVVERSPVLFRRTALTGALAEPERGGRVDEFPSVINELWSVINIAEESRAMLLGWLVAAYLLGIPHAILLLGGQQGSGKSWTARVLVGLVDPSPAPLRAQPRDLEGWAIPVAGSWASAFDNVSSIPAWWSDALCKGVTGDGWPRRRLYADSELVVLAFRRVLLLTSIDAGALRGDLGDRVLLVDLEPIPEAGRKTERELEAIWNGLRPRVLGALLDLLARVLVELPRVRPESLPRMADFAQVLAAMDAVLGTDALARYAAQGPRIAEEVLEGDIVGQRVVQFAGPQEWRGTASELLKELSLEETPPHGWPRDGRALGGRLRRLVPALLTVGILVVPPSKTNKTRRWTVGLVGEKGEDSAQTAQPPGKAPGDGASTDPGRADEWAEGSHRPTDRPTENTPEGSNSSVSGLSGGLGGSFPPVSGELFPDSVRLEPESSSAVGDRQR